jgi:hypothetical protein
MDVSKPFGCAHPQDNHVTTLIVLSFVVQKGYIYILKAKRGLLTRSLPIWEEKR